LDEIKSQIQEIPFVCVAKKDGSNYKILVYKKNSANRKFELAESDQVTGLFTACDEIVSNLSAIVYDSTHRSKRLY